MRLEIDGGVKPDSIGEIANAGADAFVAGDTAGLQAAAADHLERVRAWLLDTFDAGAVTD